MKRGKQGFTLTELVIVVGIIAVMASIIMPALSRAKREAKIVMCKSNLRQVGVALILYTGDFKGFVPTSSLLDEEKCWLSIMGSYYRDPRVLICPRDEDPYVLETLDPVIRGSYGYNVDIAWSGRRLSSFRNPSQILAFADAENAHIDNGKVVDPGLMKGLFRIDEDRSLSYDYAVNFLALDGHVESREFIGPDDPLFTEAE